MQPIIVEIKTVGKKSHIQILNMFAHKPFIEFNTQTCRPSISPLPIHHHIIKPPILETPKI